MNGAMQLTIPEDPDAGTRKVPFSGELYIERDDFMEDAPKKFFRLAPGREVRLRYGYFIKCEDVVKDPETGEITELRCSYDPETAGGKAPDGRKVKGTIHWVSAEQAVDAEIRIYDNLFTLEKRQRRARRQRLERVYQRRFADHPRQLQIGTELKGSKRRRPIPIRA